MSTGFAIIEKCVTVQINKTGTMEMQIVKFEFENIVYAKVAPASTSCDGINFISDPEDKLQLGFMGHKTGHEIVPHEHLPLKRTVTGTQEILFIRKGKLEVAFYNSKHIRVGETILYAGDVIILLNGGHGFRVLEDVEMIEVKQGPFVEGQDKIRFKEMKGENSDSCK